METSIKDIKVICTAPEGINLVVVKIITTTEGLYGLGCATLAYRHLAVKQVIEEYLKPLIVGRDVTEITEIWQLMHQNSYWRNGPIVNNAVSGIDMALWDIKGKMANMPLYQLFGGKVRQGVPVYRHVDGKDIEEICDKIEMYRSMNVKYIRCQTNGYGGSQYGNPPAYAAKGSHPGIYLDSHQYMRDTIELFDRIRSREGFDIELVHDVHERIHPSDSVKFAHEMEPFKLFFLEDIVSLENLDWLYRIRQSTITPLAQGELFNNPLEWKEPVRNHLIDYLRIHISQIGGITPALRLAFFAEQYGVRICWHGPGDMSPLAHAANIHIDLAITNLGIQEWSGIEPPNYVIQDLKHTKGALLDVFPGLPEYGNDGFVYANDKPGLGVDINEKEAGKYPCENTVTKWTQTRFADGSLQTP